MADEISADATFTFTCAANAEIVPTDIAAAGSLAFTSAADVGVLVVNLGPRADGQPPNRGRGRRDAGVVSGGSRGAVGVAGAVEE